MDDFLTDRPGANFNFIYPVIVTQTVSLRLQPGFRYTLKRIGRRAVRAWRPMNDETDGDYLSRKLRAI
jgi:hypothetical protein